MTVCVRGNHHRGRQVAQRGLGGEELAEPVAVLLEQRLGTGHVDRHRVGVGPDRLGVLADIGVRHDERVLHHRAGAGRKQLVEAAVERHARDHRDQDGRQRGDDREQRDDLDMEPGRRPAPSPRLDDVPDLAPDDAEEQQHRERIHAEQRDDDIIGRIDRGQAGENDEGRECRKQRHADRRRSEQAGCKSCRFSGPLAASAGKASPTVVINSRLPPSPQANSVPLRRESRLWCITTTMLPD